MMYDLPGVSGKSAGPGTPTTNTLRREPLIRPGISGSRRSVWDESNQRGQAKATVTSSPLVMSRFV